VNETADDLRALQDLLDASYAGAGAHLASIATPQRRPTAPWLVEQLVGMRLLVLATATADGRPRAGAVDGVFHRGAFHFSSSADSVRARHLDIRPAVSAVHLPGEEWAVTVHGRAVPVDKREPGYRRTVFEVYLPRYGDGWESFFDSPDVRCWRIEAEKLFAFSMEPV
jgi:hypothetical protein